MRRVAASLSFALIAATSLTGCAGAGRDIEVLVSGLGDSPLRLRLTPKEALLQETLDIDEDGVAVFPTRLEDGGAYSVTIETQPEDRRCVIDVEDTIAFKTQGPAHHVECVAKPRPCAGLFAKPGQLVEAVAAFPNLPRIELPGSTRRFMPMDLQLPPKSSSYMYAAFREGVIARFRNHAGADRVEYLLDIRSSVTQIDVDDGLLSFALDPRGNGDVYVLYVTSAKVRTIRLSRFKPLAGGPEFNPKSEQVLLDAPKIPGARSHSGGTVRFGIDGFLYATFGDGGFVRPPVNNAQDTSNVLGSMVRIAPGTTRGYTVPADNPWVGRRGARPEIWAWGLRNPFRFSVDPVTGAVWVADVGWDSFEEVDIVEGGRNYGWPLKEGPLCHAGTASCEEVELTDPVFSIPRDDSGDSHAIIGGFVYRGNAIPELQGHYLFTDFNDGEIWALRDPYGEAEAVFVADTDLRPVGFAPDENGEPLVIDLVGGLFYRLERPSSAVASQLPAWLSESDCTVQGNPSRLVDAFEGYNVQVPLWSDGADKSRFIALPEKGRIAITASGDLELPVGTVLAKEFRLNDILLETRFYLHRSQDDWAGYTFRWNHRVGDALLVESPETTRFGAQPWLFPGPSQCPQCHTAAAGRSLGVEISQLLNPSDSGVSLIDSWVEAGRLDSSALSDYEPLPSLADKTAPIGERARAYLHANCSHCHQPSNGLRVSLDLRLQTPLSQTGLCAAPQLDAFGLEDARIVAAGRAEDSVLLHRVSSTAAGVRMPPLATSIIDQMATGVLRDWINDLDECPPP